MIPAGVEIFVATTAVDLRYGFERLSGLVAERIGQNARSGALFVFFGKRGTSVKVLFADRTGLCLFYKRLDKGTFRVPDSLTPEATHVVVNERELDEGLDGIAIDVPEAGARTRRVH